MPAAAKRLKSVGDAETDAPETGDISHSLLDELFGDAFFKLAPVKWYLSVPAERRQFFLVVAIGAALFLPMLGQFGLWDPWETHFGEVGREMLARHDWVRPWWERVWFFSKPPLTMWLDNVGLWLSGAEPTVRNQELGGYAEWGMRLPIALLSLGAVGMVYLAGKRLFGARVGLIAALATATSPLYCILARQTITDTPFVAMLTIGMCCFLIAEFDPQVKSRAPYLYAFYACVGLATLAKEIPFGLGIPGAVILAYILLTWDWALLTRVRLFSGAALTLLIAVPWVAFMAFFKEIEEEGETFNHRYWLHDNFSRLLSGVHTTSPNAPWTYYVEQLGYGMYPWSALIPAALATTTGLDARDLTDRKKLFVGLWALVPFTVISLSATKFEHYAFPCFPPLALLVALYLEQVWQEGLRPHTFTLLLSGGFFAMIGQAIFNRPKILTEMFTYNPERPYPDRLIADPGPVIAALVLTGGVAVIVALMSGGKGKAKLWGLVTIGLGVAVYISSHMGPQGWTEAYTGKWQPKDIMGGIFLLGGVLAATAAVGGMRGWFLGAIGACALAFSGYLSWVHWEQLSPHWAQRQILHTYYTQRLPGEPLGAYLMNWKGETFYTKNEVRQMQQPQKLEEFLREPAGPENRHWVITDTRYYKNFLQQMTGEGHRVTIKDDSSVKFFLVTVE